MKNFQITNKNGIKLKTSNKYVDEDINISIDSTNLVSENIKKGVEILGVTGTFESGGGANITSNIKIVANKSSVLSSNHNKLCIVNDTSDLTYEISYKTLPNSQSRDE